MAWYALWMKCRKHYEDTRAWHSTPPVHSHRRQWRDTYCGWEQLSFAGTATTFEGGVRSIRFCVRGGIHQAFVGAFRRLVAFDGWLPTIVEGIAGLSLADNTTGRPFVLVALSLDGINSGKCSISWAKNRNVKKCYWTCNRQRKISTRLRLIFQDLAPVGLDGGNSCMVM